MKKIIETVPAPCPYGMAYKAKRILAGLGIAVLTGCSSAALQSPSTATVECRRDVLLDALRGDLPAALEVLTGKRLPKDVLREKGLNELESDGVLMRLLSCEPLTAPPPLPGNKVL